MQENTNFAELDLKRMFKILRHRAWIIILSAIGAVIAAFLYTHFCVTPLYQSSTMLYVNNSSMSLGSSFSISSSDLYVAQSLVDTYAVILKSRNTLNDVIDQADLPYSYSELSSMISAEAVNETEVFEVVVTGANPEEVAKIANAIAIILPQKISAIVEGSSARVVDYAVTSPKPFSPSYSRNIMVALLLALIASILIVLLYDMLSETIRSEDYLVIAYSDIPLLAVIPDALNKKPYGYYKSQSRSYSYYSDSSSGGEQ